VPISEMSIVIIRSVAMTFFEILAILVICF
jgi:hypothetical protein